VGATARSQKLFVSPSVDLHKTRYEYKSTGGHPISVVFFLFRTPDNTNID